MYVLNSSLHFKCIGLVILIILSPLGYDDVISEPMIYEPFLVLFEIVGLLKNLGVLLLVQKI
jgi:hypothetical protein